MTLNIIETFKIPIHNTKHTKNFNLLFKNPIYQNHISKNYKFI